MIRTLIVDDERLARASVRVLCERDPEVEIVGEHADGPAALRAIAADRPDLVFLDVAMPGMSGFDVLRGVRERRFAVVFVTAFEEHALAAFDAQARDYVLKPFDDERFARALTRAKAEVRRMRLEAAPPALDRIEVREHGRVIYVPVADIDWIEADDYYALLHVGTRSYLLRESLRDLEARLDPDRFLRIHRSAIVAIERVAELRPVANGDYCVRLRSGTDLRLSRARRDRLRALLAR